MTLPNDIKRISESNRAAWNEAMPLHRQASKERLDQAFQQPGYVKLGATEIELLNQVSVQGKDIIHLCCNNGIELLSLKNLGAQRCVGVDISDEAIQEAAQRAELCQIDCQFIRSDVYELDSVLDNNFDLVYISAGCLGWLPDLKLFFQKAASLLRENGLIFIHEIHPFSEMLPFDSDSHTDYLRIIEPYFKKEPYVEKGGLDYVGHTQYIGVANQYWFVHTLGDIFSSLIANGFAIQQFKEYEQDISAGHQRIEKANAGVPLSYILVARKEKKICPA
jgi:ubiquinone/menaquinone biosynthesis C-methylase UbiE